MPTAPTPPTPAPIAPDRSDRPNFNVRATNWAIHQGIMAPEMHGLALNGYANAVEANASAVAALASQTAAAASAATAAAFDNATGTSTTSMLISVANGKAFTTQAGKTWVAGMDVIAYNSAANFMVCRVASYVGTTLTLDCSAFFGSGTFTSWSFFAQTMQRIPILSAAAALMNPVSSLDNAVDSLPVHGFGSIYLARIVWGSSQFVLTHQVATNTVGTSPTGAVWTTRTVTGLAAALISNLRMNGANGLAYGASGTTAVSKTTDSGVTWAAAAALPAALTGTSFMSYHSGGACLLALAGTGYVTNDNGTTWSALQTLPATFLGLTTINGLFFGWTATTGYTSATGLTGSWTATALPGSISTPAYCGQDAGGGLVVYSTSSSVWRTTNGTSWTDLGFTSPSASYIGLALINGNWCQASTLGGAYTYMGTKHLGAAWTLRSINYSYVGLGGTDGLWASNGAGVWVGINRIEATDKVARVEPALNTARGLFTPL